MDESINIWLVGNTGLRNPNRIWDGFKFYAESSLVGNLHGHDQEIAFMNLLNEKGIIHNEKGKDVSGSHARKWRLMFAKNGLIFPQIRGKVGFHQEDVGKMDEITPFGKTFLLADTYPAIQECFLRAMSVEQFVLSDKSIFSPLRWILAIMLELERRTGTSELSRIEFALWGQTTTPEYDINEVVESILDLRSRRKLSLAKKVFDRKEIKQRGENYSKKSENFTDYADMNMRYLRVSGILQRKGRGLAIVPEKHILAESLAKSVAKKGFLKDELLLLCNGAPLPSDNIEVAKQILNDLSIKAHDRGIICDISDLLLNTPGEINIACQRLEIALAKTNELEYAHTQKLKWREIADYMLLLNKGGGKKEYDEDYVIEVPKEEAAAYLEWILWRAALAINHLQNKPYEVRGFKIDSDFFPVSTAGGGKGDLYCEFNDYVILTEVTMSSNSRQEAMEGEPVRRHVSDAIEKYDKPVYGMFIAPKIDTNTAETFRHGIWYKKGDVKRRLNIVPITLLQFQKYFKYMFESDRNNPDELVNLLKIFSEEDRIRDHCDAPKWKWCINNFIERTTQKNNDGDFAKVWNVAEGWEEPIKNYIADAQSMKNDRG